MRMFRCINLQSSPSYYAVWCMMMNGNQRSKTPAIRSTRLNIHCEWFDLDKMSNAVVVVIVGQSHDNNRSNDRSICAAVSVNQSHCYHHYPISKEKKSKQSKMTIDSNIPSYAFRWFVCLPLVCFGWFTSIGRAKRRCRNMRHVAQEAWKSSHRYTSKQKMYIFQHRNFATTTTQNIRKFVKNKKISQVKEKKMKRGLIKRR